MNTYDPDKTIQEQIEVPGYLQVSKVVVWLLYAFVLFGIVMMLLRVILLMFSANPDSGFTDFVYTVSSDYLQPFRGIFPPREVGETGYLDVSALFAIIVYLFFAWGAHSLVNFVQDKIRITRGQQRRHLEELKLRHKEATAKKERQAQARTARTTPRPRPAAKK